MLQADEFEPQEIEALVQQSIPDTVRTALNRNGFADYCWHLADSTLEQAERKQVSEILSKIESTEEQLGRELTTMQEHDANGRLILIVEGIATPVPGGIQTYGIVPNGRYFKPGKAFKMPYARYEAFLIGIERQGILVWRTPSWIGTANAIVQLYKSAQQYTHTTLQRHVKIPSFHPNPYVSTLMGLKGADIGPELAQALLTVFGTPWDVLRQPVERIAEYVPGVGLTKARAILKAIGREA